jgi:hypothetical protein
MIGSRIAWVVSLLLGACTVFAEPPVPSAQVRRMTFAVEFSALGQGTRGAKADGTGFYPIRDPATKRPVMQARDQAVDVVVLNNGLVEAWVAPAWGARLLRARDLKTGVDYFRWSDDEPVQNHLPWSLPGGVKASFPFFEHGTHLEQPAGYRIVRGDDGSVTVAMDTRFTQYTSPAERQRYGRFADESLAVWVTLRPGSSVVEWNQRKDNPNPLPRAERFWNDTLYPVDRPTVKTTVKNKEGVEEEKRVTDMEKLRAGTKIIYPARWVTDHGPTALHTSPHHSALDNWNISHFAIDAPYGFVGVYDVATRTNRLRINDDRGMAAKAYTNPGTTFIEHWGGVGYVFEKPGALRPAHEPVAFTHWFWTPQGIGEASFANRDVAVAVDGRRFELVTSAAMPVVVKDASGNTVAQGDAGPHAIVRGEFDGTRLIVSSADRVLMDQTFPLDRPTPVKDTPVPPEIKKKYDEIVASASLEGEMISHNEGVPRALDGIKTNPRLAYRFGKFDEALRLIDGQDDADAAYLRGLIAWEKGEAADFSNAGWQAGYMRALQAIQKSDTAGAVGHVDEYLKHVPMAWYPRLAKAFWSGDTAAARSLAEENPASPEAQLVLKLLGEPNDLDALLKNNPDADKHVALFESQLTKGQWQHLPRYPVEIK